VTFTVYVDCVVLTALGIGATVVVELEPDPSCNDEDVVVVTASSLAIASNIVFSRNS